MNPGTRRTIVLCCVLFSTMVSVGPPARALASGDLVDQPLEELTNTGLSTLPKDVAVTTASKYAQSSRAAPAALRVVTAEDIRTYGYRTLAEALRSLPGLYVSHDRNYSYLGVRGFSRPGDYNSRILLLIDGVRINDAVYDSFLLGNEFLLDVDLIERIEYMPGPGSALYGNNAFLGVINVISNRGADWNGGELAGSYGSFDTYQARGSYGRRFDNGAEMLLSATGFDRDGPDHLFYREYDTPDQNDGKAVGLDYDRYHSAFGKFSWKALTFEGAYVDRTKGIPTGSFEQIFNDPASRTEDQRTFLALTYHDQIAQDWNVYSWLDYHQYDYRGDYPYSTPPPRTLNRDLGYGEWWGGEFRLTSTWLSAHKIALGATFQDNLQQSQKNSDVGGLLYLDKPLQSTRYGVYVQDEYRLLDSLTLLAGGRYDYNPLGGGSLNPRVGLIWQALDTTTLKLLYGTAFRAPNAFEIYWVSPTSKANPELAPENIETLEGVLEHFFTPATRLSAAVYHYKIDGLISLTSDPGDGLSFYDNLGSVRATGVELEGEQRFRNGIRAHLSYAWQQAENEDEHELSNSPQHQLKLNVSAPLWSERWRAGFQTQYMSERLTKAGEVGDYVLSNLNITGDIVKNLQLSFGIYNLWNAHYADPVGEEFVQDAIFQDGRNFRLKLNVRF